jgi:hypothetical protein
MNSSPFSFARHSIHALGQAVKRLLRRWTKPHNDALVVNAALDLTRSRMKFVLENALLRQPLIVQPDTLLRWHRELFRRVWRRKSRSESKPGRPPLTDEVIALIKRMARESHTWGAERIRGELLKLHIEVAKSTVQRHISDVHARPAAKQTWANAICERFLGRKRRECLDHILVSGERHLHLVVKEYVHYFNHARPHQGIGQRIPCPPERLSHRGKVVSLPVLGGLHHDYHRQAA